MAESQEETGEKNEALRCRHCHSDKLRPGAGTCPECGQSQGTFWPKVRFVSFLIGFISVTLGSLSILYDHLDTFITRITRGDDIYFVSVQTEGQSTLFNNGYRSLIALRAEFNVPQLNFYDSINLYTTVAPGELSKTGSVASLNRSISFSTETDRTLLQNHPEYFRGEATLPNDPDYKKARDASARTSSFPCTGTLYFQPVGSDLELHKDFECIGIITFNSSTLPRSDYLYLYLSNGD